MSRYIDAEWLRKELGDTNMDVYTDEVKEYIGSAPSIDIVRCKDCKHLYSDADTGKACEFTNMGMDPEDFCSFGERSEE